MISQYEQNKLFNPSFDRRQFETLISIKMFKERQVRAAILIQSLWRGHRDRVAVAKRRALVIWATRKIQSAFRLWHFLNVGPKIRKAKLRRAATMV